MVRFGNESVSFILRLSDRENAYQRRRPFPFAYMRSTASSVVLRGSNFPTYPFFIRLPSEMQWAQRLTSPSQRNSNNASG